MNQMEQFKSYLLRTEGLELTTIKLYVKLMTRVLKSGTSPAELEAFVDSLIGQGRNNRYVNHHVIAIRHYGKFIGNSDMANLAYCKERRSKRYMPAIMTDEEIDSFLQLRNPYPAGCSFWKKWESWTMFWEICARHGCRMGEAASLRKHDVDIARGVITFNGKTGVRNVPISSVMLERLKSYIDNVKDYLFTSIRTSKLGYVGQAAWQYDFRRRIDLLKLQYPDLATRENLTSYSFRHSAGTRWAEENWSISKIQGAMGHSRLETTQKYLHMSLKGVREMIDDDRLSQNLKSSTDQLEQLVDTIFEAGKRSKGKLNVSISREQRGEVTVTIKTL